MKWTNTTKKNSVHLKVFSSLNFEKSEERCRRARGFYFYFKTAAQSCRATQRHTELQKYTVWQCGATLIIDDKKCTKCSLNKSLTFSNELFLVQFLQNICRSISALSQISLRSIFIQFSGHPVAWSLNYFTSVD